MTDQTYYWTEEWQRNEAAAVDQIMRGLARRFNSADEAIAWLLTTDHREDLRHWTGQRETWCVCGVAGFYESNGGRWVCPRSVKR